MRFRRLKELNETELMKELEIDPDLSNCQEFDFTLLKSLNATNEQTLDISAMNNVNHGGYGNILPRTITNMTNFYSEVPPRSKSFATNEDIKQNLTPSHIQNLDLICNRSNSRPQSSRSGPLARSVEHLKPQPIQILDEPILTIRPHRIKTTQRQVSKSLATNTFNPLKVKHILQNHKEQREYIFTHISRRPQEQFLNIPTTPDDKKYSHTQSYNMNNMNHLSSYSGMPRSQSKPKIVTTPKLVIDSREKLDFQERNKRASSGEEVKFMQNLLFKRDQNLIQGSKFSEDQRSKNEYRLENRGENLLTKGMKAKRNRGVGVKINFENLNKENRGVDRDREESLNFSHKNEKNINTLTIQQEMVPNKLSISLKKPTIEPEEVQSDTKIHIEDLETSQINASTPTNETSNLDNLLNFDNSVDLILETKGKEESNISQKKELTLDQQLEQLEMMEKIKLKQEKELQKTEGNEFMPQSRNDFGRFYVEEEFGLSNRHNTVNISNECNPDKNALWRVENNTNSIKKEAKVSPNSINNNKYSIRSRSKDTPSNVKKSHRRRTKSPLTYRLRSRSRTSKASHEKNQRSVSPSGNSGTQQETASRISTKGCQQEIFAQVHSNIEKARSKTNNDATQSRSLKSEKIYQQESKGFNVTTKIKQSSDTNKQQPLPNSNAKSTKRDDTVITGISENIQSSLMMIRNVSNPKRVSRRISLINSSQTNELSLQNKTAEQIEQDLSLKPQAKEKSQGKSGSHLGVSIGIENFKDIFGSDVGRETLKKDYASTPFKYKDSTKKLEYSLTKKNLIPFGDETQPTQIVVNNMRIGNMANPLKSPLDFQKSNTITEIHEGKENTTKTQNQKEQRKLDFSNCDDVGNEESNPYSTFQNLPQSKQDSIPTYFHSKNNKSETPKDSISEMENESPLFKGSEDFQTKLNRELGLGNNEPKPFKPSLENSKIDDQTPLKTASDQEKIAYYEKKAPEWKRRIKELFMDNEDLKSQLRIKSKQTIELVYQSSAKNSNRSTIYSKPQIVKETQTDFSSFIDTNKLKEENSLLLEQISVLKQEIGSKEHTENQNKFQIRKLQQDNSDLSIQSKKQKETIVSSIRNIKK